MIALRRGRSTSDRPVEVPVRPQRIAVPSGSPAGSFSALDAPVAGTVTSEAIAAPEPDRIVGGGQGIAPTVLVPRTAIA